MTGLLYGFENCTVVKKWVEKCYGRIFVNIDAWHHNKTAILKLCAHPVRSVACALIFNITYNTLH